MKQHKYINNRYAWVLLSLLLAAIFPMINAMNGYNFSWLDSKPTAPSTPSSIPSMFSTSPAPVLAQPNNAIANTMWLGLQKTGGFAAPYLAKASPYIAVLAAWKIAWHTARYYYSEKMLDQISDDLKGFSSQADQNMPTDAQGNNGVQAVTRKRVYAFLDKYPTSERIQTTFNETNLIQIKLQLKTQDLTRCIQEDKQKLQEYENSLRTVFLGTRWRKRNIGFNFDGTLRQCFKDNNCGIHFNNPSGLPGVDEAAIIVCMHGEIAAYDASNWLWNITFGGVTGSVLPYSTRGKNSFKQWTETLLDIKRAQWHLAAFEKAITQAPPRPKAQESPQQAVNQRQGQDNNNDTRQNVQFNLVLPNGNMPPASFDPEGRNNAARIYPSGNVSQDRIPARLYPEVTDYPENQDDINLNPT